jgi:hypothetical protein
VLVDCLLIHNFLKVQVELIEKIILIIIEPKFYIDGEVHDNPFYVPPDEEVLFFPHCYIFQDI